MNIYYLGGINDNTLSYEPETSIIHENRLTITLNEVNFAIINYIIAQEFIFNEENYL